MSPAIRTLEMTFPAGEGALAADGARGQPPELASNACRIGLIPALMRPPQTQNSGRKGAFAVPQHFTTRNPARGHRQSFIAPPPSLSTFPHARRELLLSDQCRYRTS